MVIVSFLLFRFFDIVKPYPARRLEGLHGGLGIMCDDLVAGLYAAMVHPCGRFFSNIFLGGNDVKSTTKTGCRTQRAQS